MEPEVHFLDAEQAVATLGAIVIRVIAGARTEVADIDRVAALVDRTLERSASAGVWIIAHHGSPVPDAPVRRHAGQVFRRHGDRLVIAYSLVGLGFWASAAIAAVSAVSKLIGVRSPTETSLDRGAERLCMELIGVDPTRLIAAHEQLLRRIQEHARACR